MCVAVFAFDATSDNQVSFSKGDRIEIVSKAGESTGWWKGRVNNKVGVGVWGWKECGCGGGCVGVGRNVGVEEGVWGWEGMCVWGWKD